jgi:hypothetical protein
VRRPRPPPCPFDQATDPGEDRGVLLRRFGYFRQAAPLGVAESIVDLRRGDQLAADVVHLVLRATAPGRRSVCDLSGVVVAHRLSRIDAELDREQVDEDKHCDDKEQGDHSVHRLILRLRAGF